MSKKIYYVVRKPDNFRGLLNAMIPAITTIDGDLLDKSGAKKEDIPGLYETEEEAKKMLIKIINSYIILLSFRTNELLSQIEDAEFITEQSQIEKIIPPAEDALENSV